MYLRSCCTVVDKNKLRHILKSNPFKVCVVIPHFEHHRQIDKVLERVIRFSESVVIVDDGSSEPVQRIVEDIISRYPTATLLRHASNQGKGVAVQTAMRYAIDHGYTHAIQIDADGQHCIEDLPRLINLMQISPRAIICGRPVFDESIPAVRYYGKKLTDWWVNLQTLSREIADSMCGYRGYPLAQVVQIMDSHSSKTIGHGMDFDVGMIVHAYWAGVPIRYFNTKVTYPKDGVSHFHYVRDNIAMTRMHLSLALGMLRRLPALVSRRRTPYR